MNEDREKYILSSLLQKKRVLVKDLAKELFASEPSIRRDLKSLEERGVIKRVHGGAVIEEQSRSYIKIPFVLRELESYDAKVIIGKRAAELVKSGDTVMLDASSSAYAVVPHLKDIPNLTVITSGIKTLELCAELGINAYSTGGRLLSSCFSLVDSDALNMLSGYNGNIAFFSCRGVSEDGMITDFSIDEDAVRKKMIDSSDKAYLLCTEEKIGHTYMHNICSVNDIDGIITEGAVPPNFTTSKKA